MIFCQCQPWFPVSLLGFKLWPTFIPTFKYYVLWGLKSANEWGWGQWEEEVIPGLKGINIVSLKMSMSASQTDHLGHHVALNQLQRQKGKQGKVIKLEKGKLFQELLSNELHQREKVVCIGFRIMKTEHTNRTPLPSVNKYPFNGECTSSFLSNYCSILSTFQWPWCQEEEICLQTQEVVEIHWVQ